MAAVERRVADGQYTTTVYVLIREQKYADAVKILSAEVQNFPRSRAALSLLGYCYYHMSDFASAVQCYEQLCRLCPDVEEYKLYHAQCLLKAGNYSESLRASLLIESQPLQQRVAKLQAAVKYEQDEMSGARQYLEQALTDDPDVIVANACILFKEGKYADALAKFNEAIVVLGFSAHVTYNIALCHYRLKQYGQSLKYIADIIERGIREHPELSVGSNTEGIDVRSVGNSRALEETALVEAFNLKAAIEYHLHNLPASREALSDMPPRQEEELDSVSLHNLALMHMDDDPTGGFKKLNFLLSQTPCPPETFGNLLLLYSKYQYYDLAADVLAENSHLTFKHLDPEMYEFLDAMMSQQASPAEAYRKFDDLATKHTDQLRKLTKAVQDARLQKDNDALKQAIQDYDDALERFVPVLMSMARIYWDREHYPMVEKIFRQSREFCSEHPMWRLNVAHTLFMQDKFKEAIPYYDRFVQETGNVLDVTPVVLANLCVSYIMATMNEEAEELMKRIEKAEEELVFQEPDKQPYHLCIVNLVIGTLYCAKGNYEFGISRVMKSLEPYQKKLMTDTWFYAKRCLLGLLETLGKHMIMLKDQQFQELMEFLDAAYEFGKTIPADLGSPVAGALDSAAAAAQQRTVAQEARMLKNALLQLED